MKMLTAALACVMTMSIMAPCSAYALDAPGTEDTSTGSFTKDCFV